MSGFSIDTGTVLTGAAQFVPDWMADMMPDAATDAEITKAYAHHLIGSIGEPKKMETVVKHTLQNWPFLGALGRENPGLFLEFIVALYERYDGGE